MKKYKLTLSTISPIILSPRMQGAMYNEIDYKKDETESNYEIIYPFYSYDNRYNQINKKYCKAKDYYIPASSLKGALQLEKIIKMTEDIAEESVETEFNREEKRIMNIGKYFICRDIMVDSDYIELRNLQKYQYLYQNKEGKKEPKLENFFPKVGVEMLKNSIELSGEIIVKELEIDWQKSLSSLNKITKIKLNNSIEEINRLEKIYEEKQKEILEKNYKKGLENLLKVREKLKEIKCEVDKIPSACLKAYIFLGGFKGLLHSLSDKVEKPEVNSTSFFIDSKSNFLYGLATVKIEEENVNIL